MHEIGSYRERKAASRRRSPIQDTHLSRQMHQILLTGTLYSKNRRVYVTEQSKWQQKLTLARNCFMQSKVSATKNSNSW